MSGEASKAISKEVLWGGGRSPFSVSYGKMMMWYFLVSDALTFSGLLVAYGFSRASSTAAWPIGEQVFRALPGLEGHYPLIYVEWSHFIHGSGGSFLLAEDVTVTGPEGETFELTAGDAVYMDHHFGHLMEMHLAGKTAVTLSEDGGHVVLTELGDHPHEAHLHGLTLNKYVEGETVIEGDAMMNLWNARSTDFAFGANLHDSEYAFQQSYSNFFFFITGFHGFHVFSGVIINIVVFFMVLNRVMERRKHYEMVEKVGLYWHFVDLVWVFVFTFFYLI